MCSPEKPIPQTQDAGRDKQQLDAQGAFVESFAQLFAHSIRTPVLRTPKEYGLEYEDVWFPSLDGVVLEGWFIPCKGSKKLIIANHPLPCNRYGFPGHLEQYNQFGGFEVNFVKDFKALNDAGFNVLAYDFRNHGRSGVGSGGVVGIGQLECRDVVGSIKYAKSRPDTGKMQVALLSRCLGANSTIIAMARWPEVFKDIKSMVAIQPVSARPLVERAAKNNGWDRDASVKAFGEKTFNMTGFHIDDFSPLAFTSAVKIPTFVAQVHDDTMTFPTDVQAIYDGLASKEKDLYWIRGTDRRFDGYNWAGENPEKMVNWFNKYM